MLNPALTDTFLVRSMFGLALLAFMIWASERVQFDLDHVFFGQAEALIGVMWGTWPAQYFLVAAKLIGMTLGCFLVGSWFFRTIARSKWSVVLFVSVLAILDFDFASMYVFGLASSIVFFSWVLSIPAFTDYPDSYMAGASQYTMDSDEANGPSASDDSYGHGSAHMEFNPATGLPMVNGCFDVGGNLYGHIQFNPATGLPMVNGFLDFGGNPYGVNLRN